MYSCNCICNHDKKRNSFEIGFHSRRRYFFLFKVDNSRLTTNNSIQNDLLATAVLLTVAVAAMLAVADTATAILLGVAVTATTTFVMLAVGTAKSILSYLRYV